MSFTACQEKLKEEVVTSYPDGKPSSVNYYKWKDNKKEVKKAIHYYSNGTKEREEEFEKEQRDGLCTYWYENGQKWSEGTFKNGLREGKGTVWNQDGSVMFTCDYKEGEANGKWVFYSADGKKEKTVYYDMGKVTKEELNK